MFTKIKIISLNIILLGLCCVSQAMEHNPVIENAITIDCQVENPLCICYLNSNCIAIGGSSGVQLVSKNGSSTSEEYNKKHLKIIYQLFPYDDSHYVAVGELDYHVIDFVNNRDISSDTLLSYTREYYFVDTDGIKAHERENVLDIQLYPRYMPKNIFQEDKKNYVAAAVSSTHILALLDQNKNLEFWHYPKNTEYATRLKTIDLSHIEPRMVGNFPFHIPYQRIFFSPEGLDIAIALPTACFIIPLPFSLYPHLHGNTNIDKLISFIGYTRKKGQYWLPPEIRCIISTNYYFLTIKK